MGFGGYWKLLYYSIFGLYGVIMWKRKWKTTIKGYIGSRVLGFWVSGLEGFRVSGFRVQTLS